PEYTSKFERIFPELAKSESIELIPFLLEDVAGIPELNQGDGIHPTVKGQKIVAKNVWEILRPLL
ncbi:MAG: arylesterase, partial [Bacteroidota bacterium]|nr:arylesterase [Bacteroidota bacterium]